MINRLPARPVMSDWKLRAGGGLATVSIAEWNQSQCEGHCLRNRQGEERAGAVERFPERSFRGTVYEAEDRLFPPPFRNELCFALAVRRQRLNKPMPVETLVFGRRFTAEKGQMASPGGLEPPT